MVEMRETAEILAAGVGAKPRSSSTRSDGAPAPSTGSPSPGRWRSICTTRRGCGRARCSRPTTTSSPTSRSTKERVGERPLRGARVGRGRDLPAAPRSGGRQPVLRHPGGASRRPAGAAVIETRAGDPAQPGRASEFDDAAAVPASRVTRRRRARTPCRRRLRSRRTPSSGLFAAPPRSRAGRGRGARGPARRRSRPKTTPLEALEPPGRVSTPSLTGEEGR